MDDLMVDRILRKCIAGPGGCVLFVGYLDRDGYGLAPVRRRSRRVHRVVYEATHGAIPAGLHLDHLCRVRNCVNPAHLEPKTASANLHAEGSLSIPAQNIAKTHCPQGHAYDKTNTYVTRKGSRRCRTCDRQAHRLTA